jgi:hypothetical protein
MERSCCDNVPTFTCMYGGKLKKKSLPDRDTNRAVLDYKAEALLLEITC